MDYNICDICDKNVEKVFICKDKKACKDCIIEFYNDNNRTILLCFLCNKFFTENELDKIREFLDKTLLDKLENEIQCCNKIKNNKTPDKINFKKDEKSDKKENYFIDEYIRVLDNIYTPCCKNKFLGFDGCLTIKCDICKIKHFCGACYEVLDPSLFKEDYHEHIRLGMCEYASEDFENPLQFEKSQRVYQLIKFLIFDIEEKDNSFDYHKKVFLNSVGVLNKLSQYDLDINIFKNLFYLFHYRTDLQGINIKKIFKRIIFKDFENLKKENFFNIENYRSFKGDNYIDDMDIYFLEKQQFDYPIEYDNNKLFSYYYLRTRTFIPPKRVWEREPYKEKMIECYGLNPSDFYI